jgi:hypothetical protein
MFYCLMLKLTRRKLVEIYPKMFKVFVFVYCRTILNYVVRMAQQMFEYFFFNTLMHINSKGSRQTKVGRYYELHIRSI